MKAIQVSVNLFFYNLQGDIYLLHMAVYLYDGIFVFSVAAFLR